MIVILKKIVNSPRILSDEQNMLQVRSIFRSKTVKNVANFLYRVPIQTASEAFRFSSSQTPAFDGVRKLSTKIDLIKDVEVKEVEVKEVESDAVPLSSSISPELEAEIVGDNLGQKFILKQALSDIYRLGM